MNAMVFAAGMGSRLGEITKNCPKALVEVGEMSVLGRVLLKLRDTGVKRCVVNVHHFADMVEKYLASEGNFGMEILVSDERAHLLDTGGGLLKASHLFDMDESLLLHNVDVLTDFPLAEMVKAHLAAGADATLLVSERSSSRQLLFTAEGRMCGWTNLLSGEVRTPFDVLPAPVVMRAFGGVHIINPKSVLQALAEGHEPEEAFSITPFYVDRCRELDIRGFTPREPYMWFDIGRPETLAKAREAIK